PNTVLNTIVAESLDYVASELEKRVGKKPGAQKLQDTVKALLKELVSKHRRIVFDGDNYSAKWREEAEHRGLPILDSAAEALPVLKSKKALDLFRKYKVLSNRELKARVEVFLEIYNTLVAIEARTMISMLNTHVLPASLRFQTELAQTVAATQATGLTCDETVDQLETLISMVQQLREATEALAEAGSDAPGDLERHARHMREAVIPAMDRARQVSDRLEAIIPADLWSLPTYEEMLLAN
ncbi:MAG: hypothetical protein JSV91_14635, partial [Phycisphaerales bacterium]